MQKLVLEIDVFKDSEYSIEDLREELHEFLGEIDEVFPRVLGNRNFSIRNAPD